MDVILFENRKLSFCMQAREAAAAIQGKMVDVQRKKSKGLYNPLHLILVQILVLCLGLITCRIIINNLR